ncbi:13530_t:CDS:2 [Funneliformis geosporum]|uniref:13530_t:CDS:1 n=1 Tax=Funneliformis geosporum TaxID=1117311 RepID=A0A9W4WPH3_9GLOM|nr:13530_t:CDS:2 [Funneliformis geosporum]
METSENMSLPGKIKLFPNEDNQDKNICQLFDQDIFKTEKEYQEVEEKLALIELREKLEKGVGEAESYLIEKKIRPTPQLVITLRQLGITQKRLAYQVFHVSERTIRNLEYRAKNPKKEYKKRGRPLKITGYNLSLLKTFINPKDKRNEITKTQQEAVEEYRKIGLDLNQSTISRTLTREKQTGKVGTKEYYELNIEKVKQFVLDNYWLYSYSNCFSLDEFGFYANEVHRFVYSRKGCRAKKIQVGEKGTRFTVILCVQNIAEQGKFKVGYKTIKNIRKKEKRNKSKILSKIKNNKDKEKEKKGTTAVDLHDFIERINFPDDSYILLDNAKIHHAVKSLIKENRLPIKDLAVKKGIILKYLPARAPMIQPAELFINAVKYFIKKKLKEFIGKKQLPTDEEVENIIKQAIEDLEKRDLTKTFLHCRDKLNVKPNYKSGK